MGGGGLHGHRRHRRYVLQNNVSLIYTAALYHEAFTEFCHEAVSRSYVIERCQGSMTRPPRPTAWSFAYQDPVTFRPHNLQAFAGSLVRPWLNPH